MLRPFFTFYGGKWRDTPRHFPPPAQSTIVEPFAGSAGYSLRYPDRDVVLVDVDPTIAGLWRYLINVDPAEVLTLPDLEAGQTTDDLDLEQPARDLIGFWLNKGANAPRKSPSRWMRDGVRPGSFWGGRVRATIAAQVPAIRHWQIIEGDYTAADGVEATYFVDPPYQVAGTHYRHGAADLDFEALATWVRTRRGLVIACEGAGGDWLPFRPLAVVKTTRAGRSLEQIWTSADVPPLPDNQPA